MTKLFVRSAVDADFDAIQGIYAEAVTNSVASFELVPPSVEEMRSRRRRLVDAGYPFLVAIIDDHVVGYGYAGPFRDRPAYRRTVESSVYVSAAMRRRGVARLLMVRLIDECASAGFRQMIAVIGGKQNPASIGLHETLGFDRIGVLSDVGSKFDTLQDITLMQRSLDPGAA